MATALTAPLTALDAGGTTFGLRDEKLQPNSMMLPR
jgi:hypothetical protein